MLIIIDNYDSFTYNLYQAVLSFEKEVQVIRNDKISVSALKECHPKGVILSPGPGRPEEAGICIELIQAFLTDKLAPIPLLGVCLGHQALTIALGGKVISSGEIVHGKEDDIFHNEGSLYQNLPQPFKAGRYHSLIAERKSLPANAIIEAQNSQDCVMGIRHEHLPLFGVQFHPESILTPEGPHLIYNFIKMIRTKE